MFLVRALRCVIRYIFETEIGFYGLYAIATRLFRVQPRMILIMPAISSVQISVPRFVFVIRKKWKWCSKWALE